MSLMIIFFTSAATGVQAIRTLLYYIVVGVPNELLWYKQKLLMIIDLCEYESHLYMCLPR